MAFIKKLHTSREFFLEFLLLYSIQNLIHPLLKIVDITIFYKSVQSAQKFVIGSTFNHHLHHNDSLVHVLTTIKNVFYVLFQNSAMFYAHVVR